MLDGARSLLQAKFRAPKHFRARATESCVPWSSPTGAPAPSGPRTRVAAFAARRRARGRRGRARRAGARPTAASAVHHDAPLARRAPRSPTVAAADLPAVGAALLAAALDACAGAAGERRDQGRRGPAAGVAAGAPAVADAVAGLGRARRWCRASTRPPSTSAAARPRASRRPSSPSCSTARSPSWSSGSRGRGHVAWHPYHATLDEADGRPPPTPPAWR